MKSPSRHSSCYFTNESNAQQRRINKQIIRLGSPICTAKDEIGQTFQHTIQAMGDELSGRSDCLPLGNDDEYKFEENSLKIKNLR